MHSVMNSVFAPAVLFGTKIQRKTEYQIYEDLSASE